MLRFIKCVRKFTHCPTICVDISCHPGDFQNCYREKIIKNVSKTALSAKAIFDIVIVKNVYGGQIFGVRGDG